VLAIKPVQALTGAPHMLSELIAAETSDIAPDGAATAIKPVPGLALAQASIVRLAHSVLRLIHLSNGGCCLNS
jgi:hypothetical protein